MPPKTAAPKTTKAASTATKDTKKRSSKKDPNAIKKPLSAYMFFSQAKRETIKAENPEASFGEIGKLLGARWGEMNEAQKKPYTDMAEQDKARHEAEKAARA